MYFTSLFDMMFRSLMRIHVNWRSTIFKSLCLSVCLACVQTDRHACLLRPTSLPVSSVANETAVLSDDVFGSQTSTATSGSFINNNCRFHRTSHHKRWLLFSYVSIFSYVLLLHRCFVESCLRRRDLVRPGAARTYC